jgi:hypothetical protein
MTDRLSLYQFAKRPNKLRTYFENFEGREMAEGPARLQNLAESAAREPPK